ncbi:uncharacterized protein METZ01_LOCUS256632, partial [marine metagenome]
MSVFDQQSLNIEVFFKIYPSHGSGT